MKRFFLSIISFLTISGFLLMPIPTYASTNTPMQKNQSLLNLPPDVGIETPAKGMKIQAVTPPLIASYIGDNGVEFRSYSNSYNTSDKLETVYDEFAKNTIGEEITYLSHIDLYDGYPQGIGVAGMWWGSWEDGKPQILPDRHIELFGCKEISLSLLTRNLSHEYGHHFTYYYLGKKENTDNFMNSGFNKLRNLTQYPEFDIQYHAWIPEEVAAEDYIQLFGNPNVLQNNSYDITTPQENRKIPLAWEVPGLYDYWVNLSGVPSNKDHNPPSKPSLSVIQSDGEKITFRWENSTDADSGDAVQYALIALTKWSSLSEEYYLLEPDPGRINTSTVYYDWFNDVTGDVVFKLYAMDKSANVVSSQVVIDMKNAQVIPPFYYTGHRLSGNDRYQTALQVSAQGWATGSNYVVLATGENFPDALSAAPLAKKYNAPILLTPPSSLDSTTLEELKRLNPQTVFIIGGPGALSKNVESQIQAQGIQTIRLAGQSRYDTSLEIAKQMGTFSQIFVVTGENFPDALSAASIAGIKGAPILLTPPQGLTPEIKAFIQSQTINKSYVIGGTGVVSDKVLNALPFAQRISGTSRYDTNMALVYSFSSIWDKTTAIMATGENYPDALSGSALAAQKNAPIFLVDSSSFPGIQNYLTTRNVPQNQTLVIGGEGVVPSSSLDKIFE